MALDIILNEHAAKRLVLRCPYHIEEEQTNFISGKYIYIRVATPILGICSVVLLSSGMYMCTAVRILGHNFTLDFLSIWVYSNCLLGNLFQ